MKEAKEKELALATVCFLVSRNTETGNDELLLMWKPKDLYKPKIGEEKWNGLGGGVEPGESVLITAQRELFEETGNGVKAKAEHVERIAVVDFHNQKGDGSFFICRVHFFFVYEWTGSVGTNGEMVNPTWFPFNRMPWDDMMPADRDWLEPILANYGKKRKKRVYAKAFLAKRQTEKVKPTEVIFVSNFKQFEE
ncbi:MAG: NUDIX domain-containing protein [Candidatus Yonathbacteria bacterium]|nr:NUDIX domain-containing protein [Candidatus Yonathbacteria bacterium]